ncbi:hypothetical protein [Mucilaginibacter polytrichastri]|uniref:Uncharacterized protein n=1 Tax=Mucilaginibacter polytrichastri TaxID=1302689 RepID=A0A1Q6A2M8_9SPHI|nr:hypothetical protein [Mucilaginibacter polytrichastri]OKS88275.1 hypothetical protein RG47T_3741 [Mucilaginibacter polytrichastri]SFT13303.1 hypothetical protein SAMN04487890_11213 [Mucilaginibacter polytrichastri]
MIWKSEFEKYECNKDWKSAIDFMQENSNAGFTDAEIYIRIIYLLHIVLLEEDLQIGELEIVETSLKAYYNKSYQIFGEDSEYLFFIGKILFIAEWYFGLNDDLKPMEERKAFKMQKKAVDKDPGNNLFEWAVHFSLGHEKAGRLAKQIIDHDNIKVEWLKSKGYPGEYISQALLQSKDIFEKMS